MDDRPGESFRGQILQLRGRIGLTQRELADRLTVHVHSIQAWEAGVSFPGGANLRAMIEVALREGGFTPGREAAEAAALWAAAMREAPRLRMPFDQSWFQGLAIPADRSTTGSGKPDGTGVALLPPRPEGTRRQHWGEAPDVVGFLGRTSEREQLRSWVHDERSRVVAVLGLGGIGKTLLTARLAHDLAPSFERVYWRSLRDAPAPTEWLAGVLGFLAPADLAVASGEAAQLARLLELVRETRCLLVLDNFESVLQPGARQGGYRPGYESYGRLLRWLGEVAHQSCLLLTSREEPPELAPLAGEHSPIQMLALGGLSMEDGQALLRDKHLEGDAAAWQALVDRYGGNSLALKVIGESIRELFGGDIAEYLADVPAGQGTLIGGVRRLLDAQMGRLSDVEQAVLHRLAVRRERVSLSELATELGPRVGRGTILEAVESMRRRSLLERGEGRPGLTLQSVVLEHVTEQLIDEVTHELSTGGLERVIGQALLTATAKEYVRRSQERLIVAPVVERLVASRGSRLAAEQWLVTLLARLRQWPLESQAYGPGNLVNMLRLLRGDLRGVDLSRLAIRQAYLQEVEVQDASLERSHLVEVVLAEGFNYPTHVALSTDGAYLVAGTSTGEVCLWRVADRTLLMALHGHAGAVWGVAFSGDARLVASASFDGTIKLWQAATGQPLATLRGHAGGVNGVALSDDGQLVASGSYDGTVRLWDAADGRLRATLDGHTAGVNGVALSADGQLVASGSWDGTVRLWEAEPGRLRTTLTGHAGGVWGVALSGDGRLVASGSFDGTVKLWDASSGELLTTLLGHAAGVRGVALSRDGQRVATGSYDGTVKLWEPSSGRLLLTLQGHTGGVWGVALNRTGDLAASASYDGTVKLWEPASAQLLASMQGHAGGIWSVAIDLDGRLMATGGVDGTVKLWDATSGSLLRTLRGHSGGVWSVGLSGDGQVAASGSFDGTVKLWQPETGRLLSTMPGHTGGVRGVAISLDGQTVVSGGLDGLVKLWDPATGRLRATMPGHTGGVWGVALAADGHLVLSGGYDGLVKLWEAASGQLLRAFEGHSGGVRGVALSRDGRCVASGSVDETVRVWETESGRLLATLPGHTGGVLDVTLTDDGRLAISGSEDETIRIWEVASGRLLATLKGHAGQVYGVALRGDDRLLASGSIDGSVGLWEMPGGAPIRMLRADRRYERLDITGLTGVTEAQRGALLALGAVERSNA